MPVIATNNAANAALLYLNANSANESSALSKLASGSNIVKASDDAAGLAIGTELKSDVTVLSQAATNASQGSSILQVADGGLSSISNILQRLYALATQAASGNVSDTQRTADIGAEFTQLVSEISTVMSSTTYGSQSLLDGTYSSTAFIVGTSSSDSITVSLSALSSTISAALALAMSNISSASNAQATMSTLSSAIDSLTGYRANVGALESQFNYSSSSISTDKQNTSAAASTIMDADEAAQKSALSSADVLSQAAIAALSQASKMPQELLSLLQS
jgi:flagellin